MSSIPSESNAAAPPDQRRRRALYRATYRGTKEMDWLLGRYASSKIPVMTVEELTLFEQALVIPDPDFHAWIIDPASIAHGPFASLIADIRAFHKLEAVNESTLK